MTIPKMPFDWYEDNIEEGLSELVKYLRNNGVNTLCSCEHDGYIQSEYLMDGSLNELHSLLFYYHSENNLPVNYTIELHHAVENGHTHSFVEIKLPELENKDAKIPNAPQRAIEEFKHGMEKRERDDRKKEKEQVLVTGEKEKRS